MKKHFLLYLPVLILITGHPLYADEDEGEPSGIPGCEVIAGINRYVSTGDSADKVIRYLESNRYRCDTLKNIEKQLLICSFANDPKIDIQLTVEYSEVVDIDTFIDPPLPDCLNFSTILKEKVHPSDEIYQ